MVNGLKYIVENIGALREKYVYDSQRNVFRHLNGNDREDLRMVDSWFSLEKDW